jgi:ammonia channel protein AmtB
MMDMPHCNPTTWHRERLCCACDHTYILQYLVMQSKQSVTCMSSDCFRFTKDGTVVDMPHCNPTHMALGTFILWLGWYGFNPGSTGCMYGCMAVASKVAVNTTLAAATGGATVLIVECLLGHAGDIGPVLNGIISGYTMFCAHNMHLL